MSEVVLIAILTLCGEPASYLMYDSEEDTRIQIELEYGGSEYSGAHKILEVQPQYEIKLEEETGLKCS